MKGLICITTATVLASLFILATPRAQSVDELVAQAVTPLPEDLRAGATVLTYDLASRKRKVLRQGTNDLECRPRDPETLFTFCAHKATGPTWDLQAKLRAEGKSAEEIQAAMVAATNAGTITSMPFGTMGYRLFGEAMVDRLHPS